MSPAVAAWWNQPKGKVAGRVFDTVRTLDRQQFEVFNRFVQLDSLYDTTPKPGQRLLRNRTGNGRMHENVVASNVDTVSAQVATQEVRAVFDTDGADWATQRRARHLEWYSEGVGKQLKVPQKCRHAFKTGAAMKGTALCKVWRDRFDRPRVEPARVDDVVVDELEARFGDPKQFHHRTVMDREELAAEYPEFRKQIDSAQGGTGQWQTWAGWRPIGRNEVLVIESWRFPLGTKGHKRYQPGRHTKTIDGLDIVDEEYHEDGPPFSLMRWSRPINGWYGIGMAERIAGIQLALNRRNLQMERKLDHGAYPTTWVSQADQGLATAQTSIVQNPYGTVGVYRGPRPPETVTPPIVSPEELNDAERLSAKASQVSGVSRMASQSMKPAGIETGVALREYRDQTTQRFGEQEKDYEQFVLDTITLVIAVCKDLGPLAPKITRKTRFGSKTIEWSQVDMGEVRVWIGAASTLSRTRAGREQTVVEWSQAGIVSQDDARRLMQHPDLERAMSLYTAAIENVEHCLDEIADGNQVTPEPFMNLKLLVWRAQQEYLNWDAGGAPEEVLENLRQVIVTAAWMLSGGNQPGAAAGELGGPTATAPGPDQSVPAGAAPPMPPLPGGVPLGQAAMPAFAPPATMQLQPQM